MGIGIAFVYHYNILLYIFREIPIKKAISFALIFCLFTAWGQTEPAETKPRLTYAGKSAAFAGYSITYGSGLENLTNQVWLEENIKTVLG